MIPRVVMRVEALGPAGLVALLVLAACDAVELRFGEFGVGGLRQGDDAPEVQLCEEPQADDSGIGMDAAAAGPLRLGPACAESSDCGGAFDKCTLVQSDGERAFEPICVRSAGTRGVGECCERHGPGNDDCAPGGWCTPLGIGSVEAGPMACREMCTGVCGGDEHCLALGDGIGLCVAPCRIFGDDCIAPGIRCVAGATIDGAYFGYCARYGAGVTDSACDSDADCAQDFVCEQDSETCRQMCDDDHPCPAPDRCLPLGLGDPQSPRICRP